MTRVSVRPATAADVARWYEGRRFPTMRAVVAEMDGQVHGIGGVKFEGGVMVAFSEWTEALRARRGAMLRAGLRVIDLVRQIEGDVYAVADPFEPGAPKLLQKLGFEPLVHNSSGEVYQWRG